MINETIQSIFDRRSNRGYTGESVTAEELEILKQCALASPTARNEQSWHFSFVTSRALIEEVERTAYEQAVSERDEGFIAVMKSRNNKIFYDAPMVVFISANAASPWAEIDSGIAVQNLALAAHSLGLGSVIIGLCGKAFAGDKAEALGKKLGFPEGDRFTIAICIGKPSVTKEAHPVKDGKVCDID